MTLKVQTTDAAGNMRAMPEILAEIARKKPKSWATPNSLKYLPPLQVSRQVQGLARLVGQGGAGEITKFVEVLKMQ